MLEFDATIFYLQKAGGISKLFQTLINELYTHGVDLVVSRKGSSPGNIFFNELHKDCLSSDSRLPFFAAARYLPVCLRSDTTVFHSTYLRNPIQQDVPVVHTIHDFMYELFDDRWASKIHTFQKASAIKRASHLVTVSKATKADLVKFHPYLDEKNVSVIYNPVDPVFFRDGKGKRSIIESSGVPYFLYVGSRGYCKDFPSVLRIFSAFHQCSPNSRLICVGGGAFSVAERREMARLAIDLNVDLILECPTDELSQLYKNAVALIMPSIYEGFGIPAAEAVVAGCPVISSRNPALLEIVGDTVLSINPEVEDQVRCLVELVYTSSREDLVASQHHDVDRFRAGRVAEQYSQVYEGVS